MNKIEKIKHLITEFSAFQKELAETQTEKFITESGKLLNDFLVFLNDCEIKNRKIASDFNVFKTLNIERKEVMLHSRFIASLLNPKASHAQRDLFYNLFLKIVVKDEDVIEKFSNKNYKQYIVNTEKQNVDISIESDNPEKRFKIIIENKIDYFDRDNQVQKYYDRAKAEYKPDEILLIYLSNGKDNPDEISISETERKKLKEKGLFYSITYKNEIRNWLELAKKETAAHNVYYTIEQYLKTINNL